MYKLDVPFSIKFNIKKVITLYMTLKINFIRSLFIINFLTNINIQNIVRAMTYKTKFKC